MKQVKKPTRLKLRPSHRDKRRYLKVKSTQKKCEDAVLKYLGVLGHAKAAYLKVTDEKFKGYIVVSCLAKSLADVRTAFTLASIKIEKVSGTIKGLTK